jgi:hypothetical protein
VAGVGGGVGGEEDEEEKGEGRVTVGLGQKGI